MRGGYARKLTDSSAARRAGSKTGRPIGRPAAHAVLADHRVKLKGNEYVPPPASDDGNRHDSILLRMQLSASDAPAPLHVRLVMFTPVTSPLPVSEMATVTVPASDGFAFNPYS